MTERVKARAVVDKLDNGQYHVQVWGDPPHDFVREYTVDAENEAGAAFSCIDKFVIEMETKHAEKTGTPHPEG